MKRTLALLSLFALSSYSFAEEIKSGPLDMSTVTLKPGGKLSFSYKMGGGHAKHKPFVRLKLTPDPKNIQYVKTVEVIIEDIASSKDIAKALLRIHGEVDLLPLIKETLIKTGSKLKIRNNFTFKLPNVNQTIR